MTDYDSLQTLIVTKHGSEAPNLRFFSALDAAPSETIGNVLSRGSNVEDPWVVLRGSHVLGVNDGLVLYGEAGFSTPQYSKLKNSHGGINIFVRKRTNSR
jgi:hypothetical protein